MKTFLVITVVIIAAIGIFVVAEHKKTTPDQAQAFFHSLNYPSYMTEQYHAAGSEGINNESTSSQVELHFSVSYDQAVSDMTSVLVGQGFGQPTNNTSTTDSITSYDYEFTGKDIAPNCTSLSLLGVSNAMGPGNYLNLSCN